MRAGNDLPYLAYLHGAVGDRRCRLRICFANHSKEEIRYGIAAIAQIAIAKFGVLTRIANVAQQA